MVKSVYRYRDECLLAILKNDGVIFARNDLANLLSDLFIFEIKIFAYWFFLCLNFPECG